MTENEKSWNQTWHIPTAPNPPTGREFIGMVAKEFGIQPKHSTLSPWMIKVAGIFDSTIREAHEMLYQSASDYIFDSTKFERAFDFKPTSYIDGIRQTVAAFRMG